MQGLPWSCGVNIWSMEICTVPKVVYGKKPGIYFVGVESYDGSWEHTSYKRPASGAAG
jgi:hypothetical protein